MTNSDHFNFLEYWKKLSELYALIAKYELAFSVEQGMMFLKYENTIQGRVFVEVKKTKKKTIKNAEIVCIPQGNYICSFYPNECVTEATNKYFEHSSFIKGKLEQLKKGKWNKLYNLSKYHVLL